MCNSISTVNILCLFLFGVYGRLSRTVFSFLALKLKTDAILSREDDVISPADNRSDGQLCFYDVLADYYVGVPESGKAILNLIVQLWSQSFASHIFALLFHKWVCGLTTR